MEQEWLRQFVQDHVRLSDGRSVPVFYWRHHRPKRPEFRLSRLLETEPANHSEKAVASFLLPSYLTQFSRPAALSQEKTSCPRNQNLQRHRSRLPSRPPSPPPTLSSPRRIRSHRKKSKTNISMVDPARTHDIYESRSNMRSRSKRKRMPKI